MSRERSKYPYFDSENQEIDFEKKRLAFWLDTVPEEVRRWEYDLWRNYREIFHARLYRSENKESHGRFKILPGFDEKLQQEHWQEFQDSFLEGTERKSRFNEVRVRVEKDLGELYSLYKNKIPQEEVRLVALFGSTFYGPRRPGERLSDVDLLFLLNRDNNSKNFEILPKIHRKEGSLPYHLFGAGKTDASRNKSSTIHWLLYPHHPIYNTIEQQEMQEIISTLVGDTQARRSEIKDKIAELNSRRNDSQENKLSNRKSRIKILLLSGGISREHAVSRKSAKVVKKNLDVKKYIVTEAIISRNGLWKFEDEKRSLGLPYALKKLQTVKPDVVFIALHGAFGEDGKVQSLLESIDLKYTGSNPAASALAINKIFSQKIFTALGLHVPRFQEVSKNRETLDFLRKFWFPIVIKPVNGGSSIGTQVVRKKKAINKALKSVWRIDKHAMVQEYIKGVELTCGVIDDQPGKPIALLPTEIIPPKAKFFDYRAKYKKGMSKELTPPRLKKSLIQKIQVTALKLHTALGCSGMSRSDFILKGKKLYVLELNTIPGLTATSLLPQGARALGIDFEEMLDKIIMSALRK